MALDLSGVDEDLGDVVVTMQIPARKHSFMAKPWASSSVVIVPSDSESESEDSDDVAVISEIPTVIDLESDDCILESYQPAASSDGTLALLAVKPLVNNAESSNMVMDQDILGTSSMGGTVIGGTFAGFNTDLVLSSSPADMGLLLFAGQSTVDEKQSDIFAGCKSDVEGQHCSSSGYHLDSALNNKMSLNSGSLPEVACKFESDGMLYNVNEQITQASEKHLISKAQNLSEHSSVSVNSIFSGEHCKTLSSSVSQVKSFTVTASADAVLTSAASAVEFDSCLQASNNHVSHVHKSATGKCITKSRKAIPSSLGDSVSYDTNSNGLTSVTSAYAAERKEQNNRCKTENVDKINVVNTAVTSATLRCSVTKASSNHPRPQCSHMASHHLGSNRVSPYPKKHHLSASSCRLGSEPSAASSQPVSSSVGVPATPQDMVVSAVPPDKKMLQDQSKCCSCAKLLVNNSLSFCMAGHATCGECLQSHVKRLLASGAKVICVAVFGNKICAVDVRRVV
jgi:hypothetical protein